ncbi:transcriptional regulator BetI [uncultured Shimia sp.]|uniref:transcriptional regulator BetI n=1 Tax=uncultured Shimia sp. TaxID=573152 RepID=UPI002625350D|nr:transcriptional regulator BetI [uncultured Shimia sp.]
MTKERSKTSRTAPPDERRKQLIDATIDCISKHGITGTTIRMVSQTAHLSQGLVNFHFKSKDVLLQHTLRSLAEEHRNLWARKIASSEQSAREKIEAIVEAQFHPRVCNRKKLTVWFAFYGEASARKVYRGITADIDAERMKTCRELCKTLNTEGHYQRSPADTAASLEALFDGLWLNILMYPKDFTRDTSRTQVHDYLALCFPKHFAPERTA